MRSARSLVSIGPMVLAISCSAENVDDSRSGVLSWEDSPSDTQGKPRTPDLATVADVAIPTTDGKAQYRFRFHTWPDGPTAVEYSLPLGYPEPALDPRETPLETYLRVAPADELVPLPLLTAGPPPFGLEPDVIANADAPLRVRDLLPPSARWELKDGHVPQLAQICTQAGWAAQVEALRDLAAWRTPPENCFGGPCICEFYLVGPTQWWLSKGADVPGCAERASLEAAILAAGMHFGTTPHCVAWACAPGERDTRCGASHEVIDDGGLWKDWTRTFYNVSHARMEIANCDQFQDTGIWRARAPDEDWSDPQFFWPEPNTLWIIRLHAGWDDGEWEDWDFKFYASSGAATYSMRIASAWVNLTGHPAPLCTSRL